MGRKFTTDNIQEKMLENYVNIAQQDPRVQQALYQQRKGTDTQNNTGNRNLASTQSLTTSVVDVRKTSNLSLKQPQSSAHPSFTSLASSSSSSLFLTPKINCSLSSSFEPQNITSVSNPPGHYTLPTIGSEIALNSVNSAFSSVSNISSIPSSQRSSSSSIMLPPLDYNHPSKGVQRTYCPETDFNSNNDIYNTSDDPNGSTPSLRAEVCMTRQRIESLKRELAAVVLGNSNAGLSSNLQASVANNTNTPTRDSINQNSLMVDYNNNNVTPHGPFLNPGYESKSQNIAYRLTHHDQSDNLIATSSNLTPQEISSQLESTTPGYKMFRSDPVLVSNNPHNHLCMNFSKRSQNSSLEEMLKLQNPFTAQKYDANLLDLQKNIELLQKTDQLPMQPPSMSFYLNKIDPSSSDTSLSLYSSSSISNNNNPHYNYYNNPYHNYPLGKNHLHQNDSVPDYCSDNKNNIITRNVNINNAKAPPPPYFNPNNQNAITNRHASYPQTNFPAHNYRHHMDGNEELDESNDNCNTNNTTNSLNLTPFRNLSEASLLQIMYLNERQKLEKLRAQLTQLETASDPDLSTALHGDDKERILQMQQKDKLLKRYKRIIARLSSNSTSDGYDNPNPNIDEMSEEVGYDNIKNNDDGNNLIYGEGNIETTENFIDPDGECQDKLEGFYYDYTRKAEQQPSSVTGFQLTDARSIERNINRLASEPGNLESLNRNIARLENDLQQALRLSNQNISERIKLHSEKSKVERELQTSMEELAKLEEQIMQANNAALHHNPPPFQPLKFLPPSGGFDKSGPSHLPNECKSKIKTLDSTRIELPPPPPYTAQHNYVVNNTNSCYGGGPYWNFDQNKDIRFDDFIAEDSTNNRTPTLMQHNASCPTISNICTKKGVLGLDATSQVLPNIEPASEQAALSPPELYAELVLKEQTLQALYERLIRHQVQQFRQKQCHQQNQTKSSTLTPFCTLPSISAHSTTSVSSSTNEDPHIASCPDEQYLPPDGILSKTYFPCDKTNNVSNHTLGHNNVPKVFKREDTLTDNSNSKEGISVKKNENNTADIPLKLNLIISETIMDATTTTTTCVRPTDSITTSTLKTLHNDSNNSLPRHPTSSSSKFIAKQSNDIISSKHQPKPSTSKITKSKSKTITECYAFV